MIAEKNVLFSIEKDPTTDPLRSRDDDLHGL